MPIIRKHWLDLDHSSGHHWLDRVKQYFLNSRLWCFLEFLLLILFFLYICVNAAL